MSTEGVEEDLAADNSELLDGALTILLRQRLATPSPQYRRSSTPQGSLYGHGWWEIGREAALFHEHEQADGLRDQCLQYNGK